MTENMLRNIIISIVVFGLVIGALGIAYTQWSNDYSVPIDSTNLDMFDKMNETNDLVTGMSNDIQGSDVDTASTSYVGVVGSLVALKKVLTLPFTTLKFLVNSISDVVHVPPIFISAFLGITLIIIVFAIVGAYMRNPL